MARRIQQRRVAGWRLPDGAVSVAGTSRFANPFRPALGQRSIEANTVAVARYREALLAGELDVTVEDVRRDLTGLDLACFCPAAYPCHVDVLLEVANGPERRADVDIDPAVSCQCGHVRRLHGSRAGLIRPDLGCRAWLRDHECACEHFDPTDPEPGRAA